MSWDRKHLLVVTGGAQGIGRATALAAARDGLRVVVLDIDAEGGEATAAAIRQAGGIAWFRRCDVADGRSLEEAFAFIDEQAGPIDVLVNSAAVLLHEPPETISREQWQLVIDVGLTGAFFTAQHAGRSMMASGRGGVILTLSSIAGFAAMGRGNLAYSVAKSGLIAATRELAVEWASYGIRVNAIAPSQVDTEGFRDLVRDSAEGDGPFVSRALGGVPLGRLATTDDVVGAIRFLASDAASFITGVTLPVDGGSLALHAGGSLRDRVDSLADGTP
jgi:NAD(P)-dependent dehydrogenase (short-subunit alcohol dehydrogenase family)